MDPATPAPPSRRRACLGCAVVGAALSLAAGGALVACWPSLERGFEARTEARARAALQGLLDEGLPAALDPPGTRDAEPALATLTDGLLSAPERELLLRDALFPSPERREAVGRLLDRLDAATPALDAALTLDVWRPPPTPLGGQAWVERYLGLATLLATRGKARGGDALWEDLARLVRLAAMASPPRLVQGVRPVTQHLADQLMDGLAAAPVQAAAAAAIERSLAALERPDAHARTECLALAAWLDEVRPDRASFERLEQHPEVVARRRRPSWTNPATHRIDALRYLAFLDDRARWARLHAEAARAGRLGRSEARALLERLEEEGLESEGLLSTHAPPRPGLLDLAAAGDAWGRLARQAVGWALAAGAGPLPAGGPPVALADPFAGPGATLRWRLEGPRAATLWSVGPDGVDDAGARAVPAGAPEKDLILRLALP